MKSYLIEYTGAPWKILPPGVHNLSLEDFEALFVNNPTRRTQYCGLLKALFKLQQAGCKTVYIDGSYVTDKPDPGDYDACWDPIGVDIKKLDPVFLDFTNKRKNQKDAFEGEFFPSTIKADNKGRNFVDFFQIEKFTGTQKGIIKIDLSNEDIQSRMEAIV